MGIEVLRNERIQVQTRYRVLTWDELGVGKRKRTCIARSYCEIFCDNDDTLRRCVEQLRISDEHLRHRPEELMLWDWDDTCVELAGDGRPGGTVHLVVAWYDEEFFDSLKDVYMAPQHLEKYLEIGLPEGSMTVQHWKLIGGGHV